MSAPATLSEVPARERSSSPWPWVLFGAPFAVQAVFFLKLIWQTILTRNDTSYPESFTVAAALDSLHTGLLYSDPFRLPFNTQVYGPIFYVVGVLCTWLAHGDAARATVLLRVVSLAAFLGSVLLIGVLAHRLYGTRRAAWLAAVMALACAWCVPFAATVRPDLPAIFFLVAALWLYDTAEGRMGLIFAAGVAISLSCLTKQSMAPLLLAFLLDTLLLRRSRRVAATGAFLLGCAVLPLLLLGYFVLRQERFWPNLTLVFTNGKTWHQIYDVLLIAFRADETAIFGIVFGLLGMAVVLRRPRYRFALLFTAANGLLALLSLRNVGSGVNYVIPPWLLLALFLPAALEFLLERTAGWGSAWLVPGAFCAVGCALIVHQRDYIVHRPNYDLDTSLLAGHTLLTDNAYLEVASARPELLDPWFYHSLEAQHLASVGPVVDQIAHRQVDLILMRGSVTEAHTFYLWRGSAGLSYFSPDMVQAMNDEYRTLCVEPGPPGAIVYIALVPRDRATFTRAQVAQTLHRACNATDVRPEMPPN